MRALNAALIAGVVLLPTSLPATHVPSQITVQGKLTDPSGAPLPTGPKTLTFRIFNAPTLGTEIWPGGGGEVQTVTTGSDGLWIALIGSLIPLSDAVFADSVRWLEITVDDGLNPPVVLPRACLTTGPFAFRVATVDGASGGTITGKVSIGEGHTNLGDHAFIAGYQNVASGTYSSVSGGADNRSTNHQTTVAGGRHNAADGESSTIGGGWGNNALGDDATIAGGAYDTASGYRSTIGGGHMNKAGGNYATVSGGNDNTASGPYSSALSGHNNLAEGNISTVVGGTGNSALGGMSVVGGGLENTTWSNYAGVAAGSGNIAGGTAADSGAFVGGGIGNMARAQSSAISGGKGNDAGGLESTIGGGEMNVASGLRATIGGGYINHAEGQDAFVGGGYNNHARRTRSVVVGGNSNNAGSASWGDISFVGGGWGNQTEGGGSVIVGGYGNYAGGEYSCILGGEADTIAAGGDYSYLFGIGSKLTQDSTFMVDMPHIRFGNENGGYEFPTTDGVNGQFLKSNGAGKLSWSAAPGVPIPLQLSGSLSGPLLDVEQSGPSAAVDVTNTNGVTTTAYIATTNEGVVGFRSMNAGRLGRLDCGAMGSYNFPVERYGMLGTSDAGVFGKDSSSGNWGALGLPSAAIFGTSVSHRAGLFIGSLGASIASSGSLTRPFVLSNNGLGAGTAVAMLFQVESSANYGKGAIAYERTNTWSRGDLHFLQDDGGDVNVADLADAVMTIKNNGNVGVGTKDAAEKLEVNGNIRLDAGAGNGSMLRVFEAGAAKWALNYRPWAAGKLAFTNDIGGGIALMTLDPVNNRVGILQDSPAYRLDVSGDCHASSFPTSSDERLKKNIEPLTNVLDKVAEIRGVSFDWNEIYDSLGRSTGRREIGVIAQEIESQFPELVTHWGDQEYRAVDYGRLTAVLIEAIKELRAENEELAERVARLETSPQGPIQVR